MLTYGESVKVAYTSTLIFWALLEKKIKEFAESRLRGDALESFLSYITSNPLIYGMMYIPLNAVIISLAFNYDKENLTTMTQLCDALTRALIRRHFVSTKQVSPDFDMPQSLQYIEDISKLPPNVAQELMQGASQSGL